MSISETLLGSALKVHLGLKTLLQHSRTEKVFLRPLALSTSSFGVGFVKTDYIVYVPISTSYDDHK